MTHSDQAILARAKQTHANIRRFYLATGRSEAQWARIAQHPQKFNRVWRAMLGWPKGDSPPIFKP